MSGNSREQVWDVFAEAIQLFDRKNEDYGDAWRQNGWRGNLSRIFEKSARVRNLLWRSDPRTPAVGDEAAIETLRDMLNTIAFAIINLREEVEYGHETPRSRRLSELGQDYTPGEAQSFYDVVGHQIPHNEVVAFEPGSPQGVATTRITQEDLAAAVEGGMPKAFAPGPDEMRAAEEANSGHVRRKPRTGKPVTDNPQA